MPPLLRFAMAREDGPTTPATLAARLRRRAAPVSLDWRRALVATGLDAVDSGEVRRRLALLTDELVALLLEDALPLARAEEIGAAVARRR